MTVQTASDYSEQVALWLGQARQWQYLAMGFPSFVAFQLQQQQKSETFRTNNEVPSIRTTRYVEYRIPPLWKRCVAEFIDFVILFFIKNVFVTVILGYLDNPDINRFDSALVEWMMGKDIDHEKVMELASEIIILEMVRRIVVCTFETVFTYKSPIGGVPGGATPGKYAMGLRIVLCDKVVITPHPNIIHVTPGGDLGLAWATMRSLLKNVILAFFPVLLTCVISPCNRGLYDVLSKSVVVEVNGPPYDYNNNRR